LTNHRAWLEHEFYGGLREIGDDIRKKRAVVKMQFLLAIVIGVGLFVLAPGAVAHGGSGGGAMATRGDGIWYYPGYPYYPYPSPYCGDPYYGNGYYGNAYYGNPYCENSDPRSSSGKGRPQIRNPTPGGNANIQGSAIYCVTL